MKPGIVSVWPGDSPSDGLIYTEAKWGENTYVRNNDYWHCQDGDSTEIEVSMLVAALVRAHQPELVIETGTAWGQSTRLIGDALVANGHGRLVSLEIEEQRLRYSRWYCHELICNGVVHIADIKSLEYDPVDRVDFLFSDSNYELRVPELEHYSQWMEKDALIVFHDTAPGHGVHRDSESRDLQTQIEQAQGDRFRNIRLHTPRGVTIMEVLK
jgi:predicted O-methyltransferase YrrM